MAEINSATVTLGGALNADVAGLLLRLLLVGLCCFGYAFFLLLVSFKFSFPLPLMLITSSSLIPLWPLTLLFGCLVQALPAITSALEADAVVASITLKDADSLGALTTKVTIVELKTTLHEL